MRLYHFCCAHSARDIDMCGELRPGAAWRTLDSILVSHGLLTGLWRAPAVLWLTDMETPDRQALGLTSRTLRCDRTEFRYAVDVADEVMLWSQFADQHNATALWREDLEHARTPERWWVATTPLRIAERIDRRRRGAA